MIDLNQFDGHTQGRFVLMVEGFDNPAIASESDQENNGYILCSVIGPNKMANAKLFAASPDLLAEVKRQAEVIRGLKEFLKEVGHWVPYTHRTTRAKIAKLEGETDAV